MVFAIKLGSPSFNIPCVVLLLLLPNLSKAGPRTVTISGVISNTFFLYTGVHHEARDFRAIVADSWSTFDITNRLKFGYHSHAAFRNGEYSYYFQAPVTNAYGVVTNPI